MGVHDGASSEFQKRFDQSLFELKLREPSRKMHEETESRRKKVQLDRLRIGQGQGAGLLVALVDSDLDVLREFLEKDIDRICREVWRTQGNSVTAEFVRGVMVEKVFNTIEARIGSIKWEMEGMAERQRRSEDLFPARTHLVQATDRLKSSFSNRYEIEARELEWKDTERPKEEKERKESPIARRVTQAPAPPNAVGGFGLSRSDSNPTQVPPDFPAYFPSELKARAAVILTEAVRNFQDQKQTLELCKRVISEMTPLFCEAVTNGTMKAGMVLEEGLGGMGDLLHSLLVYNDEGPHSGFGLSDKAYRLGQEARKSEEWLSLARAVADAEGKRKGMASARGRTGQNIDRLRKECGWSFDVLADKTGIDKKLILSHVNKGTKPGPRIMREYAQAFTKELARQVSVTDLEK